jgi:hypothetical protein
LCCGGLTSVEVPKTVVLQPFELLGFVILFTAHAS